MEMRLGFASWSLLLCALLLLLIAQDSWARKIAITSGRDTELKEASNELLNYVTDGQVLTDIIQAQHEDAKLNMGISKNHEEEEEDDDDSDDDSDDESDDDSDDEDEDDDKDDDDKENDEHNDEVKGKEKNGKRKGKVHKKKVPEVNVFFTPEDLKIGKKMPIYFAPKNPSSPKFLPRKESEKIPFLSKHLPSLLKTFSFPKHSPQAKAMKYTLKQCEYEPMKGETKFCATSLESLLDFTHQIFGPNSQFKVLSTTHLTNSSMPLQNYTISQVKNISVPKVVGCHPMPYPYAVFYCHSQESDTSLFVVMVEGEDGARVEAPAVCHMDTSKWNRDHVAFDVLKVQPGACPVCHFFPPDNLVWVPLPSAL